MLRTVQVGGIEGADIPSLDDLHSLQVVGRCECGCASLDFRHLRPGQIPSLVADATGETLTGECVGILVFAYEGQFIGLEIVSYSDEPLRLEAGDFVFLPATPAFVLSGFEAVEPQPVDSAIAAGETEALHHGATGADPDVRLLGGYFLFGSPDTALLVAFLPKVIHVRGAERLSVLVRLVRDESLHDLAGRDLILARLVEVLLIEALRAAPGEDAPAGLLRGLADPRLAASIREMHREPARTWTVEQLARTATLSRSAYYQRFTRAVGLPPMEYLLAWRMALAKDLLSRQRMGVAQVAECVGYSSASTFSTAFGRYVGRPPKAYARDQGQVRSEAA